MSCLILFLIAIWQMAVQQCSGFSYTDELITLFLGIYLGYNCFILNRKILIKYEKFTALCVGIFFIWGAISTFIYDLQGDVLYGLVSGLLSVKSFICYFGARAFFEKQYRKKTIKMKALLWWIEVPMMIVAILLVINQFIEIFPTGTRFAGIKYTSFIFAHPTEVACYGVCSLLLSVFIRNYLGIRSKWYRNYIPALVIVLISGRYKAMAFMGMLIAIMLMLPFIKGKFKFRYLLIAAPVVAVIAKKQIEYYFSGKIVTARGLLYLKSFAIARDYFPFGAGFGTYGTYFSSKKYSALYDQYGLSNVWGLSRSYSSFIEDTMWPAILGETGYVGTIMVIVFIALLFLTIKKLGINKRLSVILYMIPAYMLIESIAESIFMSSRGCLIFIILAFEITLCKNLVTVDKYIVKDHA